MTKSHLLKKDFFKRQRTGFFRCLFCDWHSFYCFFYTKDTHGSVLWQKKKGQESLEVRKRKNVFKKNGSKNCARYTKWEC